MPPIAAAIIAVGQAVIGAISAVAAWQVAGIAVGRILLTVGLNLAFSKLFAPSGQRASVAQRQASVTELSLGEHPREAIFGLVGTGGSLVDAYNWGADNEQEALVIAVADHEIEGLIGFYVNDTFYEFSGDGYQGDDFVDEGTQCLEIQVRRGAPGQTLPSVLLATAPGTTWQESDTLTGVAFIWVSYHVSEKVWASGRPQFVWLVQGAKLYDPRKDSTVEGGDGAHRWGQPETYEWADNARICHANFIWGVWNYAADPPQLMVGPGKSFDEAPPESVIADANLCDEEVPLKAGGTEPRYVVRALVRANERWFDIEEHFAAAMGGQLVERAGTIAVDPGAAKTVAFEFEDGDLLSGLQMRYQAKVSRNDLVNTVVARYVDSDQLWSQATAPMRRSIEDIAADGEAREQTLELLFVTSPTQAQRVAEITRRKARLQMTAVVALGPKFMLLEDGDWGTWTSQRRFGGESRTVEVQGVAHDNEGRVRLVLKEISASVFAWDPEVDELDQEQPAYLPPAALPPAAIENFDAQPVEITASSGAVSMAIRATWTPPTDQSIYALRLEYRPEGAATAVTADVDPRDGAKVVDVLAVTDVDYEIRATPLTQPRRNALTTAWRVVSLSVPITAPSAPANFTGVQNRDTIRFVWTPLPDPTLRYEIRAGVTFDLGRYVDNVAGGSTLVVWPITSDDDEVLFWIKTIHRSGLVSEDAALWVATVANVGDRNFILAEDFQADEFPGVRHDLTDDTAGGLPVLALEHDSEGYSLRRGDYFTEVTLLREFYARTWIEQRASSFIDDTPIWEDAEAPWDETGNAIYDPPIGDPGAARLETFVALSQALPATLTEGFRFNETLTGVLGAAPALSDGVSYADARITQGVTLNETGVLWYAIDLLDEFSVPVDIRIGAVPENDVALLTLSNDNGEYAQIIWRESDAMFVLMSDAADPIELELEWVEDDTLSVCVWQTTAARGLTIGSRRASTSAAGNVPISSAALFTDISVGGGSVETFEWDDTEDTWDENEANWNHYSAYGAVAPCPGVYGDLGIYENATIGGAFAQRFDMRGPIGFADFVPFVPGEYTIEHAIIWMKLSAPEPFLQTLSITRAKLNVDVADVIDRGEVDILAGGSWVTFSRPFYNPPAVTVSQRSGASKAVIVVEDIEATRFFARAYESDNPASPMDARITYAANGF